MPLRLGSSSTRQILQLRGTSSNLRLRMGAPRPSIRCSVVGDREEETAKRDFSLMEAMKPFLKLARIDKDWLRGPLTAFYWPFTWGAALATDNGSAPDVRVLAVYAVAATTLRTLACVVNDLLDKDFDAKVERTKNRPLVTGAVTEAQGWTFLGVLTVLYLGIVTRLPLLSGWSQLQVYLPLQLLLNFTYPLSKRFTYWTPAYLGLAINWSIFLGWATIQGTIDLTSPSLLPAAIASWCWCMVYETIYSHQDKKDDVFAGVKSMALLFGDTTKLWVNGFAIALIANLGYAGYSASLGWPFYIGVAIAAGHVAWEIASVDLDDPIDCKEKFLSLILFVGPTVLGAIVGGKLLA